VQQVLRQSQHDWRIAQQALSPEVQLMQQPSLVNSHLQVPQVKLHWQQQMPFWQQQMLQRPSQSMRQRFCSVPQATSSSQRQWILKPPVHFSNSTSQRGKTHQLAPAGEPVGMPLVCQPVVPLENGATQEEPRSNITLDAIRETPFEWP
jgi:hypothetical protein